MREEYFLGEISDMLQEGEFGNFSVEIECGGSIGWSSTAPIEKFNNDQVKKFSLNRRAHGLRVRSETGVLAPPTRCITFVFELKDELVPCVIIHSLYPGKDIGDLDGDVSYKEGVAFFGWNISGEGF